MLAVFGNDTVWDGMRHGTVIPEVAMGTWQTVEAAALNAGWCVGQPVRRWTEVSLVERWGTCEVVWRLGV